MVGHRASHHPSRPLGTTGGDDVGKVQAGEHLVKLRLQLGEVLQVIEAQFVAHRDARDARRQCLHGAQGGRRQTDEDVG